MTKFEIEITPQDPDTIVGGFRMEWMAAKSNDPATDGFVDADLCSGAGLGNRYLYFRAELEDGTTVRATADVSELFTDWLETLKGASHEGHEEE